MTKRTLEDPPEEQELRAIKRVRTDQHDRLSSLSDEILLHILSFLPIPSLLTCQRLSRRFHSLAGDSELWKRKYYNRWVLPRARRLRRNVDSPDSVPYSADVSRWLDHGHLAMDVQSTSWKKQYRLKHNWSTGACRVTEFEIARPPIAPVIVKLESGIVFAADATKGLRAWLMRQPESPLAECDFDAIRDKVGSPTAITAMPRENSRNIFEVVVGFENGGHALYTLNTSAKIFERSFICYGHGDGTITNLASSSGYVLTLTQTQLLTLYRIRSDIDLLDELPRMCRVTSLQASNIQDPVSLSIRKISRDIIVSIAYSFIRIGCGWSAGIQELRLNEEGETLESRVATSVDPQQTNGLWESPPGRTPGLQFTSTLGKRQLSASSHSHPPTSISYSHPYLLLSHADNTLTMYLVVSTSDHLSIKPGRRLWGHTSSVESVQVSERGKAISMSPKGNDIRIWELESVASSAPSSRKALRQDSSIRISPERPPTRLRRLDPGTSTSNNAKPRSILDLPFDSASEKPAQMRRLVGFDDEQVVVLRQLKAGDQILGCYNFT
ncbi:hypothetical protein VTO42DRAFT_8215 [Malbranchea cinnamomea]